MPSFVSVSVATLPLTHRLHKKEKHSPRFSVMNIIGRMQIARNCSKLLRLLGVSSVQSLNGKAPLADPPFTCL